MYQIRTITNVTKRAKNVVQNRDGINVLKDSKM